MEIVILPKKNAKKDGNICMLKEKKIVLKPKKNKEWKKFHKVFWLEKILKKIFKLFNKWKIFQKLDKNKIF
jgi:hypothetical protein